jgi:hypothetical protein
MDVKGEAVPLVLLEGVTCPIGKCKYFPKCVIKDKDKDFIPEMKVAYQRDGEGAMLGVVCVSYDKDDVEERLTRIANIAGGLDGGSSISDIKKGGFGSSISETKDTPHVQVKASTKLRNPGGGSSLAVRNIDRDIIQGDEMESEEEKSLTDKIKDMTDFPCLDQNVIFPQEMGNGKEYLDNIRNLYKRIAIVDFDGVIHDHVFTNDFHTQLEFFDPVPKARESLLEMAEVGFYLAINTVRQYDGKMREWLIEHKIPFHDFNGIRPPASRIWAHNPDTASHKPLGDLILDDKCIFWLNMTKHTSIRKWDWDIAMDIVRKMFPEMWRKRDRVR